MLRSSLPLLGLEDSQVDKRRVAKLAMGYYCWLTNNPNPMSPDELLTLSLRPPDRALLMQHMDDISTIYGLTAEIRAAARSRKRAAGNDGLR